jgi:hypothetical protein
LGEAEEVSYYNAYWFSFTSTTTMGFGDYILAPEVLLGRDLLIYPVVFLVGFVCLSAFLGKFAMLFRHPFLEIGKSLVDSLVERNNVEFLNTDNQNDSSRSESSPMPGNPEKAKDTKAAEAPSVNDQDKPNAVTLLSREFSPCEEVQQPMSGSHLRLDSAS